MVVAKALRTAQTYAGPLLNAKAWTQRTIRKTFRLPSEESYRAYKAFPLRPDEQFLDIGANRGQTIASIRLYRKSAPILAFEPNPILARRLADRYRGDRNTMVCSFGLGPDPGHFDLYIPFYRHFMFDGLASFDYAAAHDWLNEDRIYGFEEEKLRIDPVRCEVRRWDGVETRPGLVKIDVQGFESKVIISGARTIQTYRPVILIENSVEQAHEDILLRDDYRRACYEDGRLILDKVGRGNTFYIPAEKASYIIGAYG